MGGYRVYRRIVRAREGEKSNKCVGAGEWGLTVRLPDH